MAWLDGLVVLMVDRTCMVVFQVNRAIPGLFEAEGYALVQLPFKSSGRPHNCEIDGIFLDIAKNTVVVVEGKSGSMDLRESFMCLFYPLIFMHSFFCFPSHSVTE